MKDKVIIVVKVNQEYEMASVFDSNNYGMSGNFWDFHNGCHGLYDLPEFNDYNQFTRLLKDKHIEEGKQVEIIKQHLEIEY